MSLRALQRALPRRHARIIHPTAACSLRFSSATRTPVLKAALSTTAAPRRAPAPATIDDVVDDFVPQATSKASVGSPQASQTIPSPPVTNPFEAEIQGTGDVTGNDWSRSYHGLSAQPFPPEVSNILMQAIDPMDIEMKPDGMIYLPEIKYRRILNKAFGPGGWGLAPRGETNVGPKIVSREYALVCLGRLVAISRGQQEYFDPNGIAMATEACKSNALMRCCKDLGIASELWDPRFIREFKAKHCLEVFVEHVTTKRKRKLWRRKDSKFEYPYKE